MAWWEWDSNETGPAVEAGPVFAPSGATRVMPLGDSITRGQGAESIGGYRAALWSLLANDGHTVESVGGMGDVAPPYYQAEGSWRVEDQTGTGYRNSFGFNAVDMVRVYRPRIILAHLGTNNVSEGVSGAQMADFIVNYRHLLDSIYAVAPSTHVFIARIVLLENQWSGTRTFNDRVQSMTEAYVAKGRPYHLVTGMEDMPAGSWADGLHPNQQGYEYMASVWKTAIDAAA